MITPEMVNKAAAAMDKNFNPDRSPILAAMFSDYAEAALSAVYSGIRAQAFEEALREAAYDLRQWESAEAHMGQEDCEGPHGATAAYRLFESAIEDPAQWLLDRADSIVRSLAGKETP